MKIFIMIMAILFVILLTGRIGKKISKSVDKYINTYLSEVSDLKRDNTRAYAYFGEMGEFYINDDKKEIDSIRLIYSDKDKGLEKGYLESILRYSSDLLKDKNAYNKIKNEIDNIRQDVNNSLNMLTKRVNRKSSLIVNNDVFSLEYIATLTKYNDDIDTSEGNVIILEFK